MNAVIKETAKEAARRLSAAMLRKGYVPTALHEYKNADGSIWCWRVRCDHPNGDKWIRPMWWNGTGYESGEPVAPPEGKPLYRLPELLAADSKSIIWIVEGEKCADALAQLGLIVTTSGGSSSATATDWSPIHERTVVIWPDNDEPGKKYAGAVVTKLHALDCKVSVVDIAALALPESGDCVDWLATHSDATIDDVLQLARNELPEHAGSVIEPEPLRRPMPPAEPYPLDALGNILGDAAACIHEVVQAPAGLCAQSVLAAASLAVQAHADVVIDGRREPLSLWHITVGSSGERKSAADGWALHAHREFEHTEIENYQNNKKLHNVELAAYEAASRAIAKGNDAGAIKNALLGMGASPDAPLLPYRLVTEPTLEGLHKLYIAGQPSIGLFSDDAGEFLGGHAMSRDNRTKSAAGMSRLWDCGEFSRVRSGDGAAKHYGRRFALHLMVQPVIAEFVLSDDVLTGQGFLARCLLAWPASTVGTRTYAEVDLSTNPRMERYWKCMRNLLKRDPVLRSGTRNELNPRTLNLTPSAKELWIKVQNAIEADMGDHGDFASIRPWASKGGAQVLRIAGVLTLIQNPDALEINREAIEQAAQLTLWHLHEAIRIVGTAAVPTEVKQAEALLDWCREHRVELLHSGAALRLGPNSIRTCRSFDAAIGELERSGYAVRIEGGAVVDGKLRRRVWAMRW